MNKLDVSLLNSKVLNYEKNLSKVYRKNKGIYNTNISYCYKIVSSFLERSNISKEILINKRILEPCVGTGNFVIALLIWLHDHKASKEDIFKFLDNLYVCEVNQEAITIFSENINATLVELFDMKLEEEGFSKHIFNGVCIDVNKNNQLEIHNEINKLPKFDLIITNPPYRNLRAEIKHYEKEEDYDKDKDNYKLVKDYIKENYKWSSTGNLNLYKIITEEILKNLLREDGHAILLLPSSILNEKGSALLREKITTHLNLSRVDIFSEDHNIVDAKQELALLEIENSMPDNDLIINKNFDLPKNAFKIPKKYINRLSDDFTIFQLNKIEYEIIDLFLKYPRVKELSFLKNRRGELDLTLHKEYITSEHSELKLLRGRTLNSQDNVTEFVDSSFLSKTAKYKDISGPRIACHQVSNKNQLQRLQFRYVPKNNILGNSLNYIALNFEDTLDIYDVADIFSLSYLMKLFNSSLYNYYFNLISINNHINNFELDELPVPLDRDFIKKISLESDSLIIDKVISDYFGITIPEDRSSSSSNINNFYIDKYITDLKYLGLDIDYETGKQLLSNHSMLNLFNFDIDTLEIAKDISQKYTTLIENKVLNDHHYKLSDLDLEIISQVPVDGNWKNLSQETIGKSKRLTNISKSGGRTTLYGRLNIDKPANTISTYFNRPGNGRNIHPLYNRVLTTREAARIQTFHDTFMFVGPQREILMQIGNAIPPFFAYQIIKNLKNQFDIKTSLDLFSGAGGLTEGVRANGIKTLLAVDNNKWALRTLKINNPSIDVDSLDLTSDDVKSMLINKYQDVDFICGGPPCQGYSNAGKRDVNDVRNNLVFDYLDIVLGIKPKVFLMENVEGILSFNKGETMKKVNEILGESNYIYEYRKLNTADYGVPQIRKRVILIGISKDIYKDHLSIFPKPCDSHTPISEVLNDLQDNSDMKQSEFMRNFNKIFQ